MSDTPTALNVASLIRQCIAGKDPTLAASIPLAQLFASKASAKAMEELEDRLLEICMSSIDQADIPQFAGFIAVLHALIPALPSSSIITTWFDITLRASLKTPRLPRESVRQARELVLHGLADETHPKTASFRRMLIALYLSGINRDSSGDDALEDVALDPAEQEKLRIWKTNLEETLLADAVHNPKAFFSQINDAFQSPPSRLQIVVLLSQLIPVPKLAVQAFAESHLYSSLLQSLQLDFSTTVLTVGISVLITMLPNMACEAPVILNDSLPRLLSILCRVICWKERPSMGQMESGEGSASFPQDRGQWKRRRLAPDVEWSRLESSFDLSAAPPPDGRLYFEFLYGLWPATTLAFLRRPLSYLKRVKLKCPYVDDWDEVIDVDEVRSRVKPILRTHVIHPSIVLRDSTDELSDFTRWSADGMDVPGIVSECISLDVRNAAAAVPPGSVVQTKSMMSLGSMDTAKAAGQGAVGAAVSSPPTLGGDTSASDLLIPEIPADIAPTPTEELQPVQELVANQIVLKSSSLGLDAAASTLRDTVEAIKEEDFIALPLPTHPLRPLTMTNYFDESVSPNRTHPSTPRSGYGGYGQAPLPSSPPLFSSPLPTTPPSRASPRFRFRSLASMGSTEGNVNETTAQHALEVISSLQRDVLLLRNELNFELWLKKQHLSHMGKLHRDRIVARREEAERQSLHNRLKQDKVSLQLAQEELKTLKAQQSVAKVKHNEWVQILQSKLTGYREEKRSWLAEAVELRGSVAEAKTMVAKQKEILDETDTERFILRNQLDDVMPKVQKIQEYEKQIEFLNKRQLTWDNSPEMREYRERKEKMDEMESKYVKAQQLVETLEAANQHFEKEIIEQRHVMATLDRQGSSPQSPTTSHRTARSFSSAQSPSGRNMITVPHEKFLALETEHLNTKTKNIELEEKVEELEAMVEYLKYEVKQRGGLRRASMHVSRPENLAGPSTTQ